MDDITHLLAIAGSPAIVGLPAIAGLPTSRANWKGNPVGQTLVQFYVNSTRNRSSRM